MVTFDDYIRAFKQSTLYRQYLQGSPSSHGLDRNELLGLRIQRLSDPTRLATIVANYSLNCPSQIAYHTSRGKRFLGLPNDLLIVL